MAEGRTISTWTPAEERRFRALRRHLARKNLANLRARYEGGERAAVLLAIAECAKVDLPMPEWLAFAFLERWRHVLHFHAKKNDWNEAFGRPHPRGAHMQQRRRLRLLESEIVVRVMQHEKAGEPIPWPKLARELSSSPRALQQLYYQSAHYLRKKSREKKR